ncbi:MAG TPA: ORF6N domain-containing protein [Steroidobacteraceae bacterium]|nr:ORF6N domain-containing protein [Steroidobacteraceae bacterium]
MSAPGTTEWDRIIYIERVINGAATKVSSCAIFDDCPFEPGPYTDRMVASDSEAVSLSRILQSIHHLRGQKVMLDTDLARLYRVETKILNRAVQRNRDRFPADFMFQLTVEEEAALRCQIGTLKTGRGKHRKFLPYVFTEQGVAMLSSVLRSKRAVMVNVEIVRAFVRLREMLSSNADLARKLAVLESKYDRQFRVVFDAIRQLMSPPSTTGRPIGFTADIT